VKLYATVRYAVRIEGLSKRAVARREAAIRTAELNLNYAQIRAPFSGRLGRNQASIGTLVSPKGSALNTRVQLSPIYVTFNPSETELTEIQRARTAGSVTVDILVRGSDQPPRRRELISRMDPQRRPLES
jgi:multidrug efflux system membrane fusion protein